MVEVGVECVAEVGQDRPALLSQGGDRRPDPLVPLPAGFTARALGWYRLAATLVSEIIRIEALPEDFELLACAGLRCGDFQTACRAYARFLSLI